MYERMNALVERNKALVPLELLDVRSATNEVNSILSAYGREMSAKVDSMVFAKQKKDTAMGKIDTALTRDLALSNNARKTNQLTFDRSTSENDRTLAQQNLGFAKAMSEIQLSRSSAKSELSINKAETQLSRDKANLDYEVSKSNISTQRSKLKALLICLQIQNQRDRIKNDKAFAQVIVKR